MEDIIFDRYIFIINTLHNSGFYKANGKWYSEDHKEYKNYNDAYLDYILNYE